MDTTSIVVRHLNNLETLFSYLCDISYTEFEVKLEPASDDTHPAQRWKCTFDDLYKARTARDFIAGWSLGTGMSQTEF